MGFQLEVLPRRVVQNFELAPTPTQKEQLVADSLKKQEEVYAANALLISA